MKKIILIVMAILLLTSCKKENNEEVLDEYNGFKLRYSIYCDRKYGIEYIVVDGYSRGGITIRLDENGNVIHCDKE